MALLTVIGIAVLTSLATQFVYAGTHNPTSVTSIYIDDNDQCNATISDEEFDAICLKISRKYLDETKLAMSKELIDKYCITTAQLAELMLTYSFDKSRTEIAGYAIHRILDPQNFAKLKDTYMIPEYKVAIDDLIRDHGLITTK